ncbi:MAG: FG-GAP-like repeat-containing protein, partial [Flavobacteriales bacterium]
MTYRFMLKLLFLLVTLCVSINYIKAQTTFTEDASSWNLDINGAKDGGHGWTDFDNDGDFDILINTNQNSSAHRSFLLRNDGTSFTDVTSSLAPYLKNNQKERCANWADFNSDGHPDFVRNSSFSGLEVYLQDPVSGRFGDGTGGTTPQILDGSVISGGLNSEGVGLIDYDSDGDYDIVFDNHNFGIDILENDGNGFFTHVTAKDASYDVNNPATWPKGLVQDATDGDYGSATDIDNDGFVDFAARKQDQVDFFRNIGGTFTDGVNIGQANNNNKGAISFQDFDNDGDFDLFWTENGDNQIHRNDNGTWVPLGSATGIPTSLSTAIDGIACGDVDNDGDIDIFLAGDNRGFLYINQLNDPIGGANTGSAMDFDLDPNTYHSGRDGEGCTFVDLDNDGDLDLYININGQDNQLYINNLSGAPASNYVFLDIKDSRPEMGLPPGQKMMALGATVQVIDCSGNIISGIREINGGSGHGTMDAPRIHFGLPGGANNDYVFRVSYPNVNGSRLQFDYLANPTDLGAYHFVEAEAMDLVSNSPLAEDDIICPGQTVTFNPLADNGNGADSDPTNDIIAVTLLGTPAHGNAVLNGDGTVTYTPDPGYVGNDSFQYTINDRPSCTYGGLTDVATVYVQDTEAPNLATQNTTIQLNNSGAASINSGMVISSNTDNCFTPSVSLSRTNFNCSHLGTNTITVTSTDGMGNSTSETAVVTVEDNIAPVVPTLSTITRQCSANIPVPTTTDNCAGTVSGTTSNPTSYSAQGTYSITWTFNDGNGNSSVATQSVVINDTTNPITPSLPNLTGQCSVTATAPTTTDNCAGTITGTTSNPLTYSAQGTHTITWTFNDGNGNSTTANQTVTINDTNNPTISCPSNVTINANAAGCRGNVTVPVPTVNDNCSATTLTNSFNGSANASGNYPIGTTTVNWTVTDAAGNSATCNMNVTVNDILSVNAGSNQTVCEGEPVTLNAIASGTGPFTYNWDSGLGSGASKTITPAPSGYANQNFTYTVTVTDANGCTDSDAVVIVVRSTPDVTVSSSNPTCGANNGSITFSMADHPDRTGISFSINNQVSYQAASDNAGSYISSGLAPGTYQLWTRWGDASCPLSLGSVTLTDTDNTDPIAVCQNHTVTLNGSGNGSMISSNIDGGSSDNCSISSLVANQLSFNCSDLGTNNVTLTVTDYAGNTASCVAIVTVVDNINPTLTTQNVTVQLNGAGNASITPADVTDATADNCGTPTVTVNQTTFDCSEVGANTVNVTTTDANGNSVTETATVTVQDNVDPNAVCTNTTVGLDASGNASITPADVDGGSTDNCGISGMTVSPNSFTSANLGANNVTLTVTDVNGNVSTCTAVVTVSDSNPPNAVCQNVTIQLNGAGNASIVAADIDGGSTDNGTIVSIVASQTAFDCSDVGANSVTLTVTDDAGNTDTCVATVTVEDNINPTLTTQNVTVQLNGAGNASITPADVTDATADNCGTPTVTVNQTAFDCSEVGANTVNVTSTDANGNSVTETATVTVQDNVDPIAICQDITVGLDGSGNASITSSQVD